jgi:uncharacterized protein (DUF342 family)
MPEQTAEDVDFRIISQAFDSWNVEFKIDVAELVDQQGLLRHLRLIKQKIAKSHSLTESSMLFDGILRKTRNENYVDVVVRIRKVIFEKGNPRVYFKDGIGVDGTKYSYLSAYLDLFYLDLFEKPIMLDRVMQTIFEASVADDLLDKGVIARKIQETTEKQIPIKNILIAKGTFPDIGKDAEIEFFFQAIAEPGKTDHYYSSRRVSRGDMLCRKIQATVVANPGRNVKGDIIPPRAGLDIELRAGNGSELSLDDCEVVANIDGVVVVERHMKQVKMISGTKELPQYISVKVNPVLRVEGNRVVDIASSQTVEIVGNLNMGSKILTDCEVFVSGDVEEGTLIQAADDITVEGQVRGATLQSETNIIAQQDIQNSTIHAKDRIIIKGTARNSALTGNSIDVDAIQGSSVVSRTNVTVGRINADENNILSTICVGMYEYFKQRIRENEVFVERANENLSRIELLVGNDIMKQIHSSNVQTMLMRFLAKHRMPQDMVHRKQVEIYRQLLESVPPTQALLLQKAKENIELAKKISGTDGDDGNMIVIRERMSGRAIFTVNGIEAEVPATNSSAEVTSDSQGNLIIEKPHTENPMNDNRNEGQK